MRSIPVSMPHAAFYVVQLVMRREIVPGDEFQCRTQHFMWCNSVSVARGEVVDVSMPHAAFYVVQLTFDSREDVNNWFQCRTQHYMWCNIAEQIAGNGLHSFNAARSILCGATRQHQQLLRFLDVSMPHAALYVVQPFVGWHNDNINGVSMPHAALYVVQLPSRVLRRNPDKFQCRTQHYMWCNYYRQILVSSNPVSMPHAAFYVVQPRLATMTITYSMFQCRTQHFMWCNHFRSFSR